MSGEDPQPPCSGRFTPLLLCLHSANTHRQEHNCRPHRENRNASEVEGRRGGVSTGRGQAQGSGHRHGAGTGSGVLGTSPGCWDRPRLLGQARGAGDRLDVLGTGLGCWTQARGAGHRPGVPGGKAAHTMSLHWPRARRRFYPCPVTADLVTVGRPVVAVARPPASLGWCSGNLGPGGKWIDYLSLQLFLFQRPEGRAGPAPAPLCGF